MKTDDLIQNLSLDLKPTKPMGSPFRSIALFTGLGLAILGLSFFCMSSRPDLNEQISNPKFLFEVVLSFALSVMALSLSVFLSRPGFEKTVTKLKYMTTGLLFLTVAWGGFRVTQLSQSQINLGLNLAGLECYLTVLGYAVILGATLFFWLRRGASLDPHLRGLVIGAACVALGNVGISFFCGSDNGMHILLWHFTFPMITALVSGIGLSRILLKW